MPPISDPRWTALEPCSGAGGSLSVYYSDALAAVPVRAVTKPGDNKGDPNIETGTYGLFSTCGRGLRSAFVRHGRDTLLFTTRWGGYRVLAGYYRVGWYAPVVSPAARDFALAASTLRFDSNPLALAEIDARLGTALNVVSRSPIRVPAEHVGRLVDLLESRPDGTSRYLEEIDRLERFNAYYGGYRYLGRRQSAPFSWEMAEPLLADKSITHRVPVKNESPSGWWRCGACAASHANKARLRQCPSCGLADTLAPLSATPTLQAA